MLRTNIVGIKLNPCIMNASGPRCTTVEELEKLGESKAGAIVVKTATFEAREGNPKPRYYETSLGSINSMGLPNLGYKKYAEIIPKLKEKFGKPIIASIAGLQPDHFPIILKELEKHADLVEVNLSCPNIIGKPQIAYDFEMSEKILDELVNISNKPFGVKLPPYFDPVYHKQMAEILKKINPAYIACINSPGSTLIIDYETEKIVIKPKFGGLGGNYIKPIALGNIRRFYELLEGKIPIIGVGGITSGTDIFEHLLVGASAVQVGTQYMREGAAVFERLEKELEEVLRSKGYSSVEEVVGKAKISEADSY